MICKKLDLSDYPSGSGKDKVSEFFRTHIFDRLKILAGLSRVLSPRGNIDQYQNWSDFTAQYQGEWTSMRYDSNNIWDEAKVTYLLENLTNKDNGILSIVKRKW